jgi:OmcA/MtrC family decaheme c-type cytochrome
VTPGVNMANPVNVIYDFIPATGAPLTAAQLTREDVDIATCNVCHEKLAFHGGSAACGNPLLRGLPHRAARLRPRQGNVHRRQVPGADGNRHGQRRHRHHQLQLHARHLCRRRRGCRQLRDLIHKIHNGTALVKDNYHYAGLAFNNKGFSKLGGGQRMCSTCHDGTAATNADNFKNLPSRQACGACHDGINWETGGGSTLGDKAAATAVGAIVATSGHVGRAQADDSRCILCHTPDLNKIDHRMENITKNNPEITAGLATFTYDIKSVTVNAANDTIIEFGIKQRIAPSTTDTLVSWCRRSERQAPLAGFTGSPSFLLAYALPQDGITAPVDYNNLGLAGQRNRAVCRSPSC